MKSLIPKNIFIEIMLDFLYWPFWWYGRGLLKVIAMAGDQIVAQYEYLGIGVWLKNIFTPMYGMYDWESRLISFLVRLAQIILRSALLIFWSFFMLIFILVWFLVPIFLIYQIYLILNSYFNV